MWMNHRLNQTYHPAASLKCRSGVNPMWMNQPLIRLIRWFRLNRPAERLMKCRLKRHLSQTGLMLSLNPGQMYLTYRPAVWCCYLIHLCLLHRSHLLIEPGLLRRLLRAVAQPS
jgi:hypothetical protein